MKGKLRIIHHDDNDDWLERHHKVKILEDHVALVAGIIPCSVVRFLERIEEPTIDRALASMTPEESRRCRRKFRKLRRKIERRDPMGKLSKSSLHSRVFQEIREKAHDMYKEMKNSTSF